MGREISQITEVNSQVNIQEPLVPQISRMAEAAKSTAQEWQTEPILIHSPSLNYSAALLLAELHRHMGYFPPCLRL